MRHKNQTTDYVKEAISIAYVRLLFQKPKDSISISEICDSAGFGRTTYYRHFSNDKNEMILYLAKREWERYKNENKEAVEENEFYEFLKHAYEVKNYMMLFKNQKMIDLLFVILFDIFGIKEQDDPIVRYGKDLYIGMFFGVLYDWISQGCVDKPEEVISKIKQGIAMTFPKEKQKFDVFFSASQ